MEPARGEQDDAVLASATEYGHAPQWSPLVVSGMTAAPGSGRYRGRPRRNEARSW